MVSICQADLGLAERPVKVFSCASAYSFQSARQIWVWLNVVWELVPVRVTLFQSARQIWVWLNSYILLEEEPR